MRTGKHGKSMSSISSGNNKSKLDSGKHTTLLKHSRSIRGMILHIMHNSLISNSLTSSSISSSNSSSSSSSLPHNRYQDTAINRCNAAQNAGCSNVINNAIMMSRCRC